MQCIICGPKWRRIWVVWNWCNCSVVTMVCLVRWHFWGLCLWALVPRQWCDSISCFGLFFSFASVRWQQLVYFLSFDEMLKLSRQKTFFVSHSKSKLRYTCFYKRRVYTFFFYKNSFFFGQALMILNFKQSKPKNVLRGFVVISTYMYYTYYRNFETK